MKCPNCEKEMQRGFSEIHSPPGGFLVFGLSYQHLFFTPVGSEDEKIIVDNSDKVLTDFCRYCKTAVLRTKKQDE
jgi:hypothetical protein